MSPDIGYADKPQQVFALPGRCWLTGRLHVAPQYSAASFIETVNATSLTIDPDEFMARMVAAGIPDMAYSSNSKAPPLITRTSNSSIAGMDLPGLISAPLPHVCMQGLALQIHRMPAHAKAHAMV